MYDKLFATAGKITRTNIPNLVFAVFFSCSIVVPTSSKYVVNTKEISPSAFLKVIFGYTPGYKRNRYKNTPQSSLSQKPEQVSIQPQR